MTFVAIDFETATAYHPCSVGIVTVEDGVVVDEYPNLRITSITYYQNGKLTHKVIMTEKNPPKRDILGND